LHIQKNARGSLPEVLIKKYVHDLYAGQDVSNMLLFRTHNLIHGTLVFINMPCYKYRHRNGEATHKYVNENDITVLKPEIKADFSQRMQNEPFHTGTTPTKSCILLENETRTIIFNRIYMECYGYQIFHDM